MRRNSYRGVIALMTALLLVLLIVPAFASGGPAETNAGADNHAWWFWPLILLVVTFVMGIFAVLGGVGGGVLFVPIISTATLGLRPSS